MWFRRRSKTNGESEAALRDSQKNLANVEERAGEVTEIAEALRQFRERNHFAEQLQELFVRRRGRLQ